MGRLALARLILAACATAILTAGAAVADDDMEPRAEALRSLPAVNEAHKAGRELPPSSPFHKLGTSEIAPFVSGGSFAAPYLGAFIFHEDGRLEFQPKRFTANLPEDLATRFGLWSVEAGCLHLDIELPGQKADHCFIVYASDKMALLGRQDPRRITMMLGKN